MWRHALLEEWDKVSMVCYMIASKDLDEKSLKKLTPMQFNPYHAHFKEADRVMRGEKKPELPDMGVDTSATFELWKKSLGK